MISKILYIACISILITVVCSCSRGVDKVTLSDLESENSTFRALALHEAVSQSDKDNLSKQIELLLDEDPAVRFYAIMSLEKITGTDNGYDYRHSPQKRRQAVIRWRQWLDDIEDSRTEP